MNTESTKKNPYHPSSVKEKLIEFSRMGMFCSFLLYLLTFSFSVVLRDAFPVICCIFLLVYYILNAKKSALCSFDGKKYFLFFYIFLFVGVIFSQNFGASFKIFSLHTFTSLALPFVALECVRTKRHFFCIVQVLVITLSIQGLNGIYQYIYGYDFIAHTPIHSGRLTGSFSDYRVGNYVALTLIPAFAIFFLLQEKLREKKVSHVCSLSLFFSLVPLAPALFLLFFSYTRNAYVTLAAAVFLYCILLRIFPWKTFISMCILAFGLVQVSNIRLSIEVLSRDGRWKLWEIALEIFEKSPFFGVGIGQYNSAMHKLQLSTEPSILAIKHPHNIYLQFLCETGIVGTVFALLFLGGIFFWGYRKLNLLRPLLQTKPLYWKCMGLLWCGFGAFLASGLAGHNFFQRWWLALVMSYLGIFMSLVVHAENELKQS